MKFLVIFISLLFIIFGGLFSYVTWDKKGIKDIKKKVDYDNLTYEQQFKVNKIISNASNICFVIFVIGFCLFIAGLFI